MIDIHMLSAELKIIQSCIEENNGEITPDIEAAFVKAFAARDQRLEALAALLKTADSEEIVISAEIARLQGLKKQTGAKIERLQELVKSLLPIGEIWNSGLHKFSYHTSQAVEVAADAVLPEVYYRTKIVTEVDKQKLKVDLKGGATVPGVQLVTRFSLNLK
jgi:hypothetical protein